MSLSAPPCPAHRKELATATCARCGHFVCSRCGVGEGDPTCASCAREGHPIPWEDSSRRSVRAYLATLGLLPKAQFFDDMPWGGGLRGPLTFAVVSTTLAAIGTGALTALSTLAMDPGRYAALLSKLNPQLNAQQLEQWLEALKQIQLQQAASGVLLAPLSAVLSTFVLAALSHLVARALKGQGSFEATFRVVAYASAAKLVGILPGFGAILGVFLGVLLTVVGIRRAHGLATGRALVVATWWIPIAFVGFCLFSLWVLRVVFSQL